jgi:hypothetical protein
MTASLRIVYISSFTNRTTRRCRNSVVGIATGYGSNWGQEFSLLHVVQTRCGAHPASYTMGTGGKAAGG